MKEKDTRWLTNGRSGGSILVGYYIVDENGVCFWVLLAMRLRFIYSKRSDWKIERLDAFIEWMMMPEMIAGLWLEAEAVEYFEAHYAFHAMPGELCDQPGFRALELSLKLSTMPFRGCRKPWMTPSPDFQIFMHTLIQWMREERK